MKAVKIWLGLAISLSIISMFPVLPEIPWLSWLMLGTRDWSRGGVFVPKLLTVPFFCFVISYILLFTKMKKQLSQIKGIVWKNDQGDDWVVAKNFSLIRDSKGNKYSDWRIGFPPVDELKSGWYAESHESTARDIFRSAQLAGELNPDLLIPKESDE